VRLHNRKKYLKTLNIHSVLTKIQRHDKEEDNRKNEHGKAKTTESKRENIEGPDQQRGNYQKVYYFHKLNLQSTEDHVPNGRELSRKNLKHKINYAPALQSAVPDSLKFIALKLRDFMWGA
jgi:hypothetical protein